MILYYKVDFENTTTIKQALVMDEFFRREMRVMPEAQSWIFTREVARI